MVHKCHVRLILHQFGFQPINGQVAVRIQHHVMVLPESSRGVVNDSALPFIQPLICNFAGINAGYFRQHPIHQGLCRLFQSEIVYPVFLA